MYIKNFLGSLFQNTDQMIAGVLLAKNTPINQSINNSSIFLNHQMFFAAIARYLVHPEGFSTSKNDTQDTKAKKQDKKSRVG